MSSARRQRWRNRLNGDQPRGEARLMELDDPTFATSVAWAEQMLLAGFRVGRLLRLVRDERGPAPWKDDRLIIYRCQTCFNEAGQ